MTKEEMELEKLALELKILKRPWFQKPSILVSLCSLVFGVYQYQAAEIKTIAAESKIVVAQKKEVKADEVIKENELKADYLSVKENKVIAVEKRLMSTEAAAASETGYIMDVWAFGVEESVVQSIRSYLVAQGNNVGFGGLLNQRPQWLALKSTVFYYDKSSKVIAQKIAEELENLSNRKFQVRWGAGLGVDKDEKDKTFFVHVVN